VRFLKAMLATGALGIIAFGSIGVGSILSATEASAWGHHSYGGYHSHGHRGETCWRTNRHTGQHFRIC
jgi:hypothetical protein